MRGAPRSASARLRRVTLGKTWRLRETRSARREHERGWPQTSRLGAIRRPPRTGVGGSFFARFRQELSARTEQSFERAAPRTPTSSATVASTDCARVQDREGRAGLQEGARGLQRSSRWGSTGEACVRADAAHRAGRRRRGRLGGRQHDGSRSRTGHGRLARRALEPGARSVVGGRPGAHHEGALHEPAGRRREQRGALDRPRRRHVDRRDAGGRSRAAQPGPGGRGRVQAGAARRPSRTS